VVVKPLKRQQPRTRGKVSLACPEPVEGGVELWGDEDSTPSLALPLPLPLQGGGDMLREVNRWLDMAHPRYIWKLHANPASGAESRIDVDGAVVAGHDFLCHGKAETKVFL